LPADVTVQHLRHTNSQLGLQGLETPAGV
jgi:hypothetical protein